MARRSKAGRETFGFVRASDVGAHVLYESQD